MLEWIFWLCRGLGPGDPFFDRTGAERAGKAEVLCGYTVYLDLMRPFFPDKEVYATGMTQEIDRCRWALETAHRQGVALVCSGDAGVYGMASPLLELAEDYPDVAVEVVPGLTAALSGGAVLGAPLAHDFCVISLSDRLTPWEVIEKRLACAAPWGISACAVQSLLQGPAGLSGKGGAHPAGKRQSARIPSAASCATLAGRVRPPAF